MSPQNLTMIYTVMTSEKHLEVINQPNIKYQMQMANVEKTSSQIYTELILRRI